MSRYTPRVALAVAATSALALVAPAFADSTSGVAVSLSSLGGTRQFAVENVSGAPLTAISLGTGGMQPFRTHVTDSNFANLTKGYSVAATMSNLYLKTTSGHNYAVKVPSSDVSLAYGTAPLSALGVSLPVLPKLSLSGTLASCANLPSSVQTTLGLSSAGVPISTDPLVNTALTSLCTALGTGVPVATTVDSFLQTVVPTLASVADLPTQLTGATPGAFSQADFGADTVGSGDPAKAGAPAATSLPIMNGTPGLSSALLIQITSKLNAILSAVPLTALDETKAKTSIAAVISALSANTTTALVANALNTLTATQQIAVLNTLVASLLPPSLANIASVSGQYYAFPSLKATPTTPVAGTYDGTLTVTFVG